MSKTIEKPETEAVDLDRLVSGEFYWIKYHGHWEVAMWEDSCKWWLVARDHATDPDVIDEIGQHVPRPTNDGTQRRLPPPLSNDNTQNENGGSRSLE